MEVNYKSGLEQYTPANKSEEIFGKMLNFLLVITERSLLFYDLELTQSNCEIKVPINELAFAKQGFVDDSAIDIVPKGAEKTHGSAKLKYLQVCLIRKLLNLRRSFLAMPLKLSIT
ncbi:MAG: hypothetical protein WCS96_02265 [Victivallales bacterium]